MICEYCCNDYIKDIYKEFCSKTCTNKFHEQSFKKDGYNMMAYEKFDIGSNELGYFVFSKEDARPSIGSFTTRKEAKQFAEQRVNDSQR